MSNVKRRDKSPGKEFWRKFEHEVEEAVAKLGNATVRRDVRIPGVLSGRPRQIDVLAKGEVAGCPMTVIFEAKCYAGVVQIGTIDELVGKALDVAAQSAVLCAPNGFSTGARARALGTQTSPLRVGVADLEAEWPGLVSGPEPDGMVLSNEVPGRLIRDSGVWNDVLTRDLGPWSLPAPAVPVETDDYGRFFRGEAPLYVSR